MFIQGREITMRTFKAYCNTQSGLQDYSCGIIMVRPGANNFVCIDGCLFQEIKFLWKNRVKTVGCCCGQHIDSSPNSAYIQVTEDCIDKMKAIGYRQIKSDCFIPKTEITKESNE